MPAQPSENPDRLAATPSSAASSVARAAVGSRASGRLPARVTCGGKAQADTRPYWAPICVVTAVTAAQTRGSGTRKTPYRTARSVPASSRAAPVPVPVGSTVPWWKRSRQPSS